jgi:cell division septation protein DedD
MVTVDKYIRKLLFEHDCVIIPDFGGLLTHHVGAHYDTTQAVFLPSSKRVAFNEVLKLDDGLLTYYISVNERISRDEAVALVKRYVDTLRLSLKEGQTVELDAIGSFSANSEGKPVFEPEYCQNFNNDWFGLESFEVRYYSETKPEKSEAEELLEGQEIGEADVVPIHAVSQKGAWIRWVAAAVVAGAVFTLSFVYKPANNSLLSTLNPFYGIEELYVSTMSLVAESNFSEPETQSEVNKEKSPLLPNSGSILVDSTIDNAVSSHNELVTPQESNVVRQPVVDNEPASGNFFLIAGSFERERNAVLLKNTLIQQGFQKASIMDAKEGKLIKVSVGSYESMHKALADKDRIDQITNAESWVFFKK